MPELDYHMHICIEGITFHYHIVCTFILKTITRYKIKYKSSIFYRLKFHKTLQYFDSSLSRNKHSNSICSQHHLLLIMYRMQLQYFHVLPCIYKKFLKCEYNLILKL